MQPPTSGKLTAKLSGLTPYREHTGDQFGMVSAISRMTNVAVNDNEDDGMDASTGIPPFITGVSISPLRRHENYTDPSWEFPQLVQDHMSAWTPFSENSPTVVYGLSAVMDNQTFDTRGVAASALSANLDIFIDKDSFMDRIADAIISDDIEAINVKAYNAAVFNNSNLAVQLFDVSDEWGTCWEVFPGLNDDPENDSHVTFFYRALSACGDPLTGFKVSDFDDDLLVRLRAQQDIT